LVLPAAAPEAVEKFKGPSLFTVAREDASAAGPRLPRIRALYERAPEPKRLVVVEGSEHAQFLFETDQGERVMREILQFLSAEGAVAPH
jgi:alpha-beta hydrolase superfamily lysophospholipase